MTNANREKLENAYLDAHIQALELLDHLRQTVEDMPAPDNDKHPINWAHVGSLNHICEQLTELKKHATTMGDR